MSKKLAWIFVLIMLASSVLGFGVAPARTVFDFNPGAEQEGAIRIIANQVPSKFVLTKEGELGEYIEFDKEVFIINEPETWIKFKVKFPADLPPGERTGGILVIQVPKDAAQETEVLAAPAIIHQIRTNVPYPGKYITGKLFITNIKLEEPTMFTIALQNFGKEDISKAKAHIIIKGPTNEEIAAFDTDIINIKSSQESKLIAVWQAENPGSYVAEATVNYDGKILTLSERFDVGNLDLEIERIEVKNFRIGQIAKLDVYMRNQWNKPLDVEGRVEIFKDNSLIASFNAVPINIPERTDAIMNAYWNTEGVEAGEYDISVKAKYNGKTAEKTFTSYVSIDSITFKNFVSGKVTSSGDTRTTFLVVAVLVLIMFNIFLFIYIRRRLRTKQA